MVKKRTYYDIARHCSDGGKASAKARSKKQRHEQAIRAATARWTRQKLARESITK